MVLESFSTKEKADKERLKSRMNVNGILTFQNYVIGLNQTIFNYFCTKLII
jgi:hypothetical protein